MVHCIVRYEMWYRCSSKWLCKTVDYLSFHTVHGTKCEYGQTLHFGKTGENDTGNTEYLYNIILLSFRNLQNWLFVILERTCL